MKEEKIDVLMLQETRMDEEETKSEKWRHMQGAGYKAFASSNENKPTRAGVATLLGQRVALLVKDKMVIRDEEGRFLAIPVRTLERGVHIWYVNIYAPAQSKEKEAFWEKSLPRRQQPSKANTKHG